MKSKKITPKYSPEVRERAVRMAACHDSDVQPCCPANAAR
jgi:transposase-like protein